jgi:hypothetical protein
MKDECKDDKPSQNTKMFAYRGILALGILMGGWSMATEKTDVGLTRGMLEALVGGKAEGLKISVPEGMSPSEALAQVYEMLSEFPSLSAVLGVSPNQIEIVAYKKI